MSKYSLSVFLFLVLTLVPALSHAEFLSGEELTEYFDALHRTSIEKPRDGDWQKVGMLQGFMMGVSDARRGVAFCAPKGTSLGRLIDITGEYVDQNPALWDRPAADITLKALATTFPCKK
ncbi:MAG TPA: Rap1a/Tai family immunity protein [Pseudomonadales bacterium]|nr:Rap1a/Tai family immunity protein [Pseudomonadales bacterium]